MKKRLLALILAIISMLVFASCANNSSNADETTVDEGKEVVTPDIPTFATMLEGTLANASKLTAVEDDYVEAMMSVDLTNVEEYTVRIQTMGTAIDQYGVFKATDDKSAKALCENLQSYIDTTRDNWENFNYLPEETPKLDGAKAVQKGVYVVYVVASADERDAFMKIFNENV